MPEWLIALFIPVFLLWPVMGNVAIGLFNRSRRNAGKPGEIGESQAPTEILARMYLWPLVLYKARKAARELDKP